MSERSPIRADRARTHLDFRAYQRGERLFPPDPADLAPTAFGNILAASADYPRLVYGMDALHWWPRLLPLLPAAFLESLRALETPMRQTLPRQAAVRPLEVHPDYVFEVVSPHPAVAACYSYRLQRKLRWEWQDPGDQAREDGRELRRTGASP